MICLTYTRFKVKMGKRGILYLPAEVRKRLGIDENSDLILTIEDECIVIKPLKSVFVLGASSRKIAEISVEEFEKESEELQRELYE